jgi:hypothetical protein
MTARHIFKEVPFLRYRAESVRSVRTKGSSSWSGMQLPQQERRAVLSSALHIASISTFRTFNLCHIVIQSPYALWPSLYLALEVLHELTFAKL